jgi:spore coat polysaccharide biosynthesis protein SpsF
MNHKKIINKDKPMKVVCIIEARLKSTRLPGKVLKPILGKPMLELMVERLNRAKLLDDLVIATTDQASDDPIVELANRIGVNVFRGSEDDVLLRVLEAAKSHEADIIVETTGDCPLNDPAMIDKVVADFLLGGADFVSNTLEYSTPRGTDVRVFKTDALNEINEESNDAADHEHVSLHFWEHPEKYRLRNVRTEFSKGIKEWRLTVDTVEDFKLVESIFSRLYPTNPNFNLNNIIELLIKEPNLLGMNNHIKQKAVR